MKTLILFLALTATAVAQEMTLTFHTVLKVLDGNTLIVKTETATVIDDDTNVTTTERTWQLDIYGVERYGGANIRTASEGKTDRAAWTKAFLAFLIPPGTEIMVDDEVDGDYVVTAGSKDIAYQMVVAGMSKATETKYREAEEIAKEAKVGIWR